MGKRANIYPRQEVQIYEVKFRDPTDKTFGNGHERAYSRVFSRHFEANNKDHAWRLADKLAKKNGTRVISITKLSPEKIIGILSPMSLRDIICKPTIKERRRDVILEDVSLEEIIFGKRK